MFSWAHSETLMTSAPSPLSPFFFTECATFLRTLLIRFCCVNSLVGTSGIVVPVVAAAMAARLRQLWLVTKSGCQILTLAKTQTMVQLLKKNAKTQNGSCSSSTCAPLWRASTSGRTTRLGSAPCPWRCSPSFR